MTEHPHPPHMPGGPNTFHPHGGHPWGAASSPWMHYHHAYNTHWRGYGCGRAKGRFLFFVLGAGAATLFFKWRRHVEECPGHAHGGGWSQRQRAEGGGAIEYPDGSHPTAAVASNRAEPDERPKWSQRGWAWREEYRRATPPGPSPPDPATDPAVPASNTHSQASPGTDSNGRVGQGNTSTWKWDQDAMVKSATGTASIHLLYASASFYLKTDLRDFSLVFQVVDLTESSLDSLVATINGLKLVCVYSVEWHGPCKLSAHSLLVG
jgi:hypothetical protein